MAVTKLSNVTNLPTSAPEPRAFTVCPGIYSIATDDKGQLADQLNARLAQLSALLNAIEGDSDEDGFWSLNVAIRNNYLWACQSLADECRALHEASQAR